MAYGKGLHIRLSVALASIVAALWTAAVAADALAAGGYGQHHYTSQELKYRPQKYRQEQRTGKSDAWRRFKVKKDRILRVKRSSFWNKRPYQFSTPTVGDGMLFVGSDSGYFYAVRVPREKKLWRFKTEGPVQSTAAYADGTVYFGDGKGYFYALNAEDGTPKWTVTLDTEILAEPLLIGSRIFVPTMSGRMYCLDAATGVENWHTPADEKEFGFSVRRSSSPAEGYGLIFYGTSTGDVRALRESDGSLVWETRVGSPQNRIYDVDSTPLLYEGQLLVASADRLLYSLDPTDGSVNWASDAGGVNDVIYKDGRLYTTGGGNLYSLDPATGTIFWSQEFDKPAMSSPAAGDGFVVVASTIDKIYLVESETGDVAYERFIRKGSLGDPIVVDGKDVYVLSNSGRLFAFEVSRVEPKVKKERKSRRAKAEDAPAE